jgi:non-ribosomal peptide synthetase component F
MSELLQDFIFDTARRTPDAEALVYGAERLTYRALAQSRPLA